MSREKRNAVGTKSGNAVSHSAPVLTKPTLPSTAGRKPEASLGSAKSGREFEGSALIGGAAAVPLASLVKKKTNRDNIHDPFRLSRCGRLSLRGISRTSPNQAKFVRVTCKCWDCPHCAPRKANKYRRAIADLAITHKLDIMLTLTLDPAKLHGEDSTQYINRVFAHFRVYLKRKLHHSPTYIRVLEQHKNGRAHLHILLNKRIPQSWISTAWDALGGGKVVDIRRVKMRRVARYLSKYLTKEMILSAPKRSRRVTTSRGLKLNPKLASEYSWELRRIPLSRIYEVYAKAARDVRYDADGNVSSFDLTLENGGETP